MSNKVTWNKIYKDFKTKHPKFAKQVLGFAPHSYATILLLFPNGVRKTYNYDTKELSELKN